MRVENTGTEINLDSDVSFSSKTRFGFRVTHVLSEKSALELSYMKHDNSGTLVKNITFDNKKFRANANMSIENSWLDLAWAYNLTRSKEVDQPGRDAFYLDGMFGIKFSNSDISVSGNEDSIAAGRLEAGWSESSAALSWLNAGAQISDNLWLKVNSNSSRLTLAAMMPCITTILNAALRLSELERHRVVCRSRLPRRQI